MVLQRNIAVPIWGTVSDSKKVTVEFNGQIKEATITEGKWMVKLDEMKESNIPFEMHIKTEKEDLVIHNILIGDVWLAGGQSNMERQLGPRPPQQPILNWEAEAAGANYPMIREFSLPHNGNRVLPVKEIDARWKECNPSTVLSFSAVAYYFAKTIFTDKKIPVGIIHSSWGGSSIQKWISKEILEANPDFKLIPDMYERAVLNYPAALKAFNDHKDSLLQKWMKDAALAKHANKALPAKPAAPVNPEISGDCGGYYKTMIEPLQPYAIKGVIWYQGESNVSNASLYSKLFPALIEEWRDEWHQGAFPFLFIQLAPYKGNTPELREAQLLTWQKEPNTAMVVTTDCGDTADVHPPYKKVIGERLALAARVIAYHEKNLEYSGPVYQSYRIRKHKILLSFKHTGSGLMVKGEYLNGFTISGDGKDFIKAKAEIKRNKVVLTSTQVLKPVAARYAFVNNANGNLFNKEGLPASPFRTDRKDK